MNTLPRLRRMNLVLRQANARRRELQMASQTKVVQARDDLTIEQQISQALDAELDGNWQPASPEQVAANIAKMNEKLRG